MPRAQQSRHARRDDFIARTMRKPDRTKLPAVAALLPSSDLRLLVRHETSHDFGAAQPAWRYRCRTAGVTSSAQAPVRREKEAGLTVADSARLANRQKGVLTQRAALFGERSLRRTRPLACLACPAAFADRSADPCGQRDSSSVLLAGNAKAGERLIRPSETPAADELQQRRTPSAATDASLLLLVRTGSQVGADEGGCSPTRARARCVCRSSWMRPPAST
jgi:hypothetical protein